jgi:cytochrome c oxidase accessory protein FixG
VKEAGEPGTTVATAPGGEWSFYVRQEKIYPRSVSGRFAAARTAAALALLGLYYGLPWVGWEGRQAVVFDLPARKFHVFAVTFWPQDFFYLALLLVVAALSLFFFTAVAGRLWCGYACPQTVWTEVFLWMERVVEGDRARQMKLAQAPWTAHKLMVKSGKQAAWIAFSLWSGFTFVGYFTPVRELAAGIAAWSLGPWEAFWILFYSAATYGNAGFLREQVCIYMCPYARFQGAMFDRDTLIISYDSARGEPRGVRKKGDHRRTGRLGDCVDCTLCVQVCPTGIDIREGLQYQCIGCASCIDVCDQVMAKVGYPAGLVRYTTENALAGRPGRILRPRVLVYGTLLLVLLSALGYALANRVPLALDVIGDRRTLYREAGNGLIENVYTLKIINMDRRRHRYGVYVSGIEGLELLAPAEIAVPGGEVHELAVRVRADRAQLVQRSSEIRFRLRALDTGRLEVVETARFLGPLAGIGR